MGTMYTHKTIYHTVDDSQPVRNVQLQPDAESAEHSAEIQRNRGFNPVSVEDNTDIEGLEHIGGQVHEGHYIQK